MQERANIELDTMNISEIYRVTPYEFAQTAEPGQFTITSGRGFQGPLNAIVAPILPGAPGPAVDSPNWILLPPAQPEMPLSNVKFQVPGVSTKNT